jgi:hypothetical protein
VDKFPVEGDQKRVEGFHVHVKGRNEILFCIQIVLVPVFYSAPHLKKGKGNIRGISMSGDISCLRAVKVESLSVVVVMSLGVLTLPLGTQVESFPDVHKFVVRNIMDQGVNTIYAPLINVE